MTQSVSLEFDSWLWLIWSKISLLSNMAEGLYEWGRYIKMQNWIRQSPGHKTDQAGEDVAADQDFYITIMLGARLSQSELLWNVSCSWVPQITCYFRPFWPIWPILAWADRPVYTSFSDLREKRKRYLIGKLGYARHENFLRLLRTLFIYFYDLDWAVRAAMRNDSLSWPDKVLLSSYLW